MNELLTPNNSPAAHNRPMGPLLEGDQAIVDAVESTPDYMTGDGVSLQKIKIRGVPASAVRLENSKSSGDTQETIAAVAVDGITAEIENSEGMSQQEINMEAARRIKSAHENLGKTGVEA